MRGNGCYVGNLAERGAPQQQTLTNQEWFKRKLPEQNMKYKATTWDGLSAILKGFFIPNVCCRKAQAGSPSMSSAMDRVEKRALSGKPGPDKEEIST
jgi:hypothetical protein